MSELLKAFYLAYLEWIDAGAPDRKPFHRDAGLCWNARNFCRTSKAWDSLSQLFKEEGLNENYPFQSKDDYLKEYNTETCHLNSKRIAWVRNQVEKIKEQQS